MKTKGDPLAMPALRTTPLSQTWPQLLQPLGFTRRTIIWDAPAEGRVIGTFGPAATAVAFLPRPQAGFRYNGTSENRYAIEKRKVKS